MSDPATKTAPQQAAEARGRRKVRMGSGKGNPEGWVAVVKPGRVLFEMGGVTPEVAKEAMKLAAAKLPMKTRFVAASETGGGR